ncbi:Isochorismatase hydrolase [Gonapodya prolifera JEL478]|uniref:Isochorismatase hydrolase n=1 Tax=Gonapodya prolifera (strain JEL478) TaxID=1344416 RepID=A0A139ADG4_GONPJ|nr:Isochorismatase hydrolase [Gonapodya prolifera JEL478]|eukprot:KXS14810.1 Isochorismatase hydrolase [Gonapodya prolifera JEL478]
MDSKDALPAARAIRALKDCCRALGIPTIYANDNFGRWRSDMVDIARRIMESSSPGRPVAELLRPGSEDYFVVKPKYSAFNSSSLDVLLNYLSAKTIIVCGYAGNVGVIFSASDAHHRDLSVVVPRACTSVHLTRRAGSDSDPA